MFKKFLLSSLIFFGFIGVTYPSNKENTKPFDYCYSFEKIISRNFTKKRENFQVQPSQFLGKKQILELVKRKGF